MNRLNFNQTGGFPLSTNILDAMQEAYSVFNSLGSLAGDKAIISGCVVAGNNVSDGVIYLNGEILSFKGGTLGATIIIKEESESRIFEDGATKPVIFKRYATFGSSTPEKTFAWADFKRFDNLVENAEKNLDFDKRLKALENKEFPIPIGLVAIWYKPASEPIPKGWKEHKPLRGKTPMGHNPDYGVKNIHDREDIFNGDMYSLKEYHQYFGMNFKIDELGAEGGEFIHKLTTDEMPEHSHKLPASPHRSESGGGWFQTNGSGSGWYNSQTIGGNKPHNNTQPYRIVKFIEFVGFENE